MEGEGVCKNSTSASSSSSCRVVLSAWELEICPAEADDVLAGSGEDREDIDKFDDDSLGDNICVSKVYKTLFQCIVFSLKKKVKESFLNVDEGDGGMKEGRKKGEEMGLMRLHESKEPQLNFTLSVFFFISAVAFGGGDISHP
jgi:hypothetical protein